MQRIEKYMDEEEVPEWASSLGTSFDEEFEDHANGNESYSNGNGHNGHGNNGHLQPGTSQHSTRTPSDASSFEQDQKRIGFENAVVSWHTATGPEAFRLRLNVEFGKGLNLVIGYTGSGKVIPSH
jgi:hypothetical protein